jgi:hypothetical protein
MNTPGAYLPCICKPGHIYSAFVQGWWVGVGENDPVGHLLHIGPEYGRYTGRVYTTRDIADLAGRFSVWYQHMTGRGKQASGHCITNARLL